MIATLHYHIGYLLRDIRRAKGITQNQVAYGLYGKSSYSRIEAGKQDPDKLLLDVLFERMGVSVNQFGTNYTIEEYMELERRNGILRSLEARKWKQVQKELQEYEQWVREKYFGSGRIAFKKALVLPKHLFHYTGGGRNLS